MTRRRLLASLAAVGVLPAASAPAQQISYFRIGTGAIGETHFPVGGILANAISNPPGGRPCAKGGSCGVPGLIAVAQSTVGGIGNVRALADEQLEAALVHADIATWAFHGGGPFRDSGAVSSLRAVAMLTADSMHVVVRQDSGIETIAGLRGRRVSLGAAGSATPVEARSILAAYGLAERDLQAERLSTAEAAERMARGELDACFVLDAPPIPILAQLARGTDIALLPIAGKPAEFLCRANAFFTPGTIPAGSYAGQDADVATLDVAVVLLVAAHLPRDMVHGITRALWLPATAKALADGHPGGRALAFAVPAQRLGIPLHPGAAEYYFDAGPGN